MSYTITTAFENLTDSAAAEALIQREAAGLDGAAQCHVQVAKQHRHHGAGNIYRVAIDVEVTGADIQAGAPSRQSCRAIHDDLAAAIATAFATVARTPGRRGAGPVPRFVSGHIAQMPLGNGAGILATEAGDEIRFGREHVGQAALASLHVGDRAWWTPAADGAGKLTSVSYDRGAFHNSYGARNGQTGAETRPIAEHISASR